MAGVLGSGPDGEGTQLFLTDGLGAELRVPNLLSVNNPNLAVDIVETTNHDSGGVREYIAGLADPGEISATMLYDPGSPIDDLLLEHLVSRDTRPFRISLVGSDGSFQDFTGNIIVTGYEPDDAPVDGRREATFTGKVTGATTQASGDRT